MDFVQKVKNTDEGMRGKKRRSTDYKITVKGVVGGGNGRATF